MKYRVNLIVSLAVEAPDADRARYLAFDELQKVAEREAQSQPTLRVISPLDATSTENQPR